MRSKSENYQLMDSEVIKSFSNKVLYISVGRCLDKCVIASYVSQAEFHQHKTMELSFLATCNDEDIETGIEHSNTFGQFNPICD